MTSEDIIVVNVVSLNNSSNVLLNIKKLLGQISSTQDTSRKNNEVHIKEVFTSDYPYELDDFIIEEDECYDYDTSDESETDDGFDFYNYCYDDDYDGGDEHDEWDSNIHCEFEDDTNNLYEAFSTHDTSDYDGEAEAELNAAYNEDIIRQEEVFELIKKSYDYEENVVELLLKCYLHNPVFKEYIKNLTGIGYVTAFQSDFISINDISRRFIQNYPPLMFRVCDISATDFAINYDTINNLEDYLHEISICSDDSQFLAEKFNNIVLGNELNKNEDELDVDLEF